MTQKIYARRVMKMGSEPEHSFMITIPRKICSELQIGKGTMLYFKLEGNKFVVSKDSKFLEGIAESSNNDMVTVGAANHHTIKEKKHVIAEGISLADLRY